MHLLKQLGNLLVCTVYSLLEFSLEQLYNTDETALYWYSLPLETLAQGAEKASGGYKEFNDRVTVLG